MTPVDISIVIPVYNSRETLETLAAQIVAAFAHVSRSFEVLFVDDGSADGSWDVVAHIASRDARFHGIQMLRNFGQHNALLCGIRDARGTFIVTMDDDLQHRPEDVPALVDRLGDQYDVVYGVPRELPHARWRNVTSRLAKGVIAKFTGNPNIRYISAFRAFRADVRKAFDSYQAPDLILDALLGWGTTRFGTLVVQHDARRQGRSSYTLKRLFRQMLLVLTGYSTIPLQIAALVGFVSAVFGLLILVYVMVIYFTSATLPGFPFLASVIAIFSGAQLFALGVIGEYLARVFNRVLDRPTYVVRTTTASEGEPLVVRA